MNLTSIVKSKQAKTCHQGQSFYLYNPALTQGFTSETLAHLFDSQYWKKQQAITGSAQGRGTTWFIKHQTQEWVLRHYYRGGLIGKLINDHYIFTGLGNTRAVKEYVLLEQLQQLNLPAPIPVACKIRRTTLTYCADLLTSRIQNAQDLVTILKQQPLNDELWNKIGTTIAQFHQHGVYHHDLNIHNILIDNDNKVWVIDFDQGEIRQPNTSWQQANIERLKRSFIKEKNKFAALHWQEKDWLLLINSYQTTR